MKADGGGGSVLTTLVQASACHLCGLIESNQMFACLHCASGLLADLMASREHTHFDTLRTVALSGSFHEIGVPGPGAFVSLQPCPPCVLFVCVFHMFCYGFLSAMLC